MMTLPLPAAPAGTVQEQAAQQYSYLVQMAQQLNLALGQLEELGSGAGAESANDDRQLMQSPRPEYSTRDKPPHRMKSIDDLHI